MPRDPLPAWFVVVVLMRFILLAHPVSSLPPKSLADQESLQARWVTPEQLPEYPLRNPEVEQNYLSIFWCTHLPSFDPGNRGYFVFMSNRHPFSLKY